MHVGVCMKIQANNMEEAERKAENILSKYSMNEEERINETKIPIKEFMELLKLPEDIDEEQFELFLNVTDKEELIRDSLDTESIDYEESLAYIADYEEYETNKLAQLLVKLGREIFPEVSYESIYLLAGHYDTPWDVFTFDLGCDENDEKYVYLTCPYFASSGYWDYDYGTSESFGIRDNDIFRINTCHARDLNPKYKHVLELEEKDEKTENWLRSMIYFYIDVDEERIDERDIDEIKELMLENITEDTYFICGSVHI